jgi:4-hydroxy-tetrahydrodipicolinate reductase
MIKVVVHGALGKVGREVVNAVYHDPETRLVGAVDINLKNDFLLLPDDAGKVPLSSDLEHIITVQKPDVMVDFSLAKAVLPAVRIAAKKKVHIVSGTTGLTQAELDEIDHLAKANDIGAVVASNFALGAVVMMHLAKIASKYFDYAEIIELHHHLKADAPSGTALTTARGMAKARGKAFAVPSEKDINMKSRGEQVEGIALHSVRLPGLMAHQEVILGTAGQTLSIRHDTINRECYMPGVLLAVKQVHNYKGLVSGLDTLLGLN